MAKMDLTEKKCLTPEFRASFPHMFEPHSGFEGQEPKYSLVMLLPKETDITMMKRAVQNAIIEKWGPDKTKWPKGLRLPFRDGDEKMDLNGYAGHWFVTASSKQRPGLINQRKEPINSEDQGFYAGCYARATLIAFAYDKAGNRGVAFSLQNVMKTRDGESFGGRRDASDDFKDVEVPKDSSEDPTSFDTDLFG